MLLGTTTEGHTNADDFTVSSSGGTGITIRSGTSNLGSIYFSDGTSGDAEYRGIVQYEHANDRLNFGTAANTRLSIDSSGRILVAGGDSYHADADDLVLKERSGGNVGMTLQNTTNGFGVIYFGDAASTTVGRIQYDHNNDSLDFFTANAERVNIGTEHLTITDGNLVIGTSGHGIDFSATGGPTNGSGTSELLDDYEEGTFTPAFTMTSGGHNISYSNQKGNYTKIGNVVTIEIYISVNGINANGSGSLIISGLPFTKTGRYGGLNISYLTATNNVEITHALIDVASTNVYLYNYSGSSVSGITVASALTTSTEIMLNGIYYAA